jgi:hypothetical protein
MALWRRDQLWFELENETTEHPVATMIIDTPVGRLSVMAVPTRHGRSLTLRGLHVQSETVDRNAIGPANLAFMVRAFMEVMDLDELVVAGGLRTTGANPGRTPRERRFTRRAADRMGW